MNAQLWEKVPQSVRPIHLAFASDKGLLPLTHERYLALLDASVTSAGLHETPKPRTTIFEHLASILERLGVQSSWSATTTDSLGTILGSLETLTKRVLEVGRRPPLIPW